MRLRPPEWMDEALCAQTDPEIFFPRPGESTDAAVRICAACPVRVECLAYGESLPSEIRHHGIWGGLNSFQRRQARLPRGAA